MAHDQTEPNRSKTERQTLCYEKRSQDITSYQSQTTNSKGARLKEIQHPQKQADFKDQGFQQHSSLTSATRSNENSLINLTPVNLLEKREQPQIFSPENIDLQKTRFRQVDCDSESSSRPDLDQKNRKRKRSQEAENSLVRSLVEPLQTQSRTSLANSVVKNISKREAANNISENKVDFISHWIQKGSWPEGYFSQNSQIRKDLEKDSWVEKHIFQDSNMSHLLARKKSSSYLRRKQSDSSIVPSDQTLREKKSAPYKLPSYEILLEIEGSHMHESGLGITDISKSHCRILLSNEQKVPIDSIFHDDRFDEACFSVHDKNEARVVRDILPLICPSAEVLAICDAISPKLLIDSVNEGWNNSISITKTRPQPDYAAGYRRSAFTNDQLAKLEPFLGDLEDASFFRATYYMYFPFLTCEVKCGAQALDVADRQNAHSMTIAVKGVVELFRYVKREKEIDREILAFSISHDHRNVRIYGHYALINDNQTTFYRHPIKEYCFTTENGKEKWTAYQFTKNIYDIWMPTHFKRICSAIDEVPLNLDFGISLADSFTPTANVENESELGDSQQMAASASSTRKTVSFKKPKLSAKAMLQLENERLKDENQKRDQEIEMLKEHLDFKEQKERQSREAERQRQESEKLREEFKHREDRLMEELKQQRAEAKQEKDQMQAQLKQEKDQMQAQLTRLIELLTQERERPSRDTASLTSHST